MGNSTCKNSILAVLALVLLGLMLTFWTGKDPAVLQAEQEKMVEPVSQEATEMLAWNCLLTDEKGHTLQMRDLYNEKPVYVLFWMPWSRDSIRQIDAIIPIYETYGKDIHVVVAALERSRREALDTARQKQWPFPVYTVPMAAAGDYHVYNVPVSVVISRGGQIKSRDASVLTQRQLAYKIERALHEE